MGNTFDFCFLFLKIFLKYWIEFCSGKWKVLIWGDLKFFVFWAFWPALLHLLENCYNIIANNLIYSKTFFLMVVSYS